MNFFAEIKADSMNPNGRRLVSMVLRYPRCIHSEFMTHRMFSRNAASSRAIPVEKMLDQIMKHPFVPMYWGRNQKGMQAEKTMPEDKVMLARAEWLAARDRAVQCARTMHQYGAHKQIVNRVVEPWMWMTVLATGNATAWENFFHLRCNLAAEPHIQKIAFMARGLYDTGQPKMLGWGDVHAPFYHVTDKVLDIKSLKEASTGRCARLSYVTHEGVFSLAEDRRLHDKLRAAGHWSPFGHVATAWQGGDRGGNLGPGWLQYRKEFEQEVCSKADRVPENEVGRLHQAGHHSRVCPARGFAYVGEYPECP